MFTGKKTYVLIAAAVGLAIAAFVLDRISIFLLFEAVFAALAIASTRAGVAKIEIAAHLVPGKWLDDVHSFLPNTKTHLAVAALVLTAVLAFLSGAQGIVLTAFIVAAALGVSALRVAIQRVYEFVVRKIG